MVAKAILIIDDETRLRELYARILALEGYAVTTASSLKEARSKLLVADFHLVLTDVRLPDGSGVDFVQEIKARHPNTEVVLVTAYGNIPDGIRAMKLGAYDYLTKGDSDDQIVVTIAGGVEKAQLRRRVAQLERHAQKGIRFEDLVGESHAFLAVIAQARQVAPTDAHILLQGETGSGKELLAEAIHHGSTRREGAYVAINCAAIPKEMLESELFGYKKGAFTGALTDKRGLLEEASGGTLLLDEIGDMPLELQAKLLRALDGGAFIKLGDTHPTQVSLRIIAATHRDLKQRVAEQSFRADLYYRLAVFTLALPALRARVGDAVVLAKHFAILYSIKLNRPPLSLTPQAKAALAAYPWPGNVRELKNVLERAAILAEGDTIDLPQLPAEIAHPPALLAEAPASNPRLEAQERAHILAVLAQAGGNKTRTAQLLGISLTTLYRKLEQYGL